MNTETESAEIAVFYYPRQQLYIASYVDADGNAFGKQVAGESVEDATDNFLKRVVAS